MQIPEVVAAFLREVELPRTPELHINPVSPEEAAQQSTDLAKTSIFGELLGLIVLDDASDSNPYCYISRGLGAGMVVHHEHDGTVAVRYPDLVSFCEALRDAVVGGDDIRDLRPARCQPHPDQAGLRAELRTRLTGKDPRRRTIFAPFPAAARPLRRRDAGACCGSARLLHLRVRGRGDGAHFSSSKQFPASRNSNEGCMT